MLRELVIKNRSYRSFEPGRDVPYQELLDLIDTARLCPSAVNMQPLKYRPTRSRAEADAVTAASKWAGRIADKWKLPPEGHEPPAYIVVCVDRAITDGNPATDIGIAAQTILLGAAEDGYGGCMLGAFDRDSVADALSLPENCEPALLIALGVPDDRVVLCGTHDGDEREKVRYFRDDAGVHFVPKRSLDDIVL